MSVSQDGFLVVLSDVKSANERDYLGWLTTEHVQERLGIPGFLGVRVFRRKIPDGYRYFIWYRLESADVVGSDAYLERLNNPTPWSRRIMPVLENFGRGGGIVATSAGNFMGQLVLVIKLAQIPADISKLLVCRDAMAGPTSVHLLVTDPQKSALRTSERALRSSDSSFAGLLVIESDSETELAKVRADIAPVAAPSAQSEITGLYGQIFSLGQS
jgi:hypothetical protein